MGKRESAMESMVKVTPIFWQGKQVLVTGHTGFKGTWLTKILIMLGAEVTGFALESPTEEGDIFFHAIADGKIHSIRGDIRDLTALKRAVSDAKPEVVFHMAAQPIVLESYRNPVLTYETNVMGTVNLLECVRLSDTVRSVVNVTTDKVYENDNRMVGYRESDRLNGHDPYSNSKSCSELVTASYRTSFFAERNVAISTMRAGNVIGGGDFAPNRIVPDCVRAALRKESIKVRNAESVRPYQHVLEPLNAYLLLAEQQFSNSELAGSYNIGPDETDTMKTGDLAELFCKIWGDGLTWKDMKENSKKEARLLRLDCSKFKETFGWRPSWNARQAIEKVVEWSRVYENHGDLTEITERQIKKYWEGSKQHGTAGIA